MITQAIKLTFCDVRVEMNETSTGFGTTSPCESHPDDDKSVKQGGQHYCYQEKANHGVIISRSTADDPSHRITPTFSFKKYGDRS